MVSQQNPCSPVGGDPCDRLLVIASLRWLRNRSHESQDDQTGGSTYTQNEQARLPQIRRGWHYHIDDAAIRARGDTEARKGITTNYTNCHEFFFTIGFTPAYAGGVVPSFVFVCQCCDFIIS